MSERTGEYMDQMKERNNKYNKRSAVKSFLKSFLRMNEGLSGATIREKIKDDAYDELLQAGVRRETMLSCPRLEDLPIHMRQIVENRLQKYLKYY